MVHFNMFEKLVLDDETFMTDITEKRRQRRII
jgi:hypothetical protein